MEKALNVLEFLSQDEQTRLLYEARQKGLHDYVSAMVSAEEKGREEGEHQHAISTARKMLLAGLAVEQIAEFVNLSVDEVKALRKGMH